jgi:hypothetical protein
MTQSECSDTYRQQLTRWARALAGARKTEVEDVLAQGSAPTGLEIFVEDIVFKRLDILQKQLEFLAGSFEDFDGLLTAFLQAHPLSAYATIASDGNHFVEWLEQTQELTPEQQDHVACHRARHMVLEKARHNRSGHVRFQELSSLAGLLGPELGNNPSLRIHLNPIRAWAQFVTPVLLGDEDEVPADVLFFAVGTAIHTAVLEGPGKSLVEKIASVGPCTLDSLECWGDSAGRQECIEMCRDLAEIGLVAFS